VFTGEVYVVDPRVDAASRALRVRAHIPNTGAKLRPGLFANVELFVEQHAHALLIPEEAVIPQREKTFVYRVFDRIAHWTEVRLGIREQGFVQVLDGLHEQDIVVRIGHHKLKDGMRVAAR
ncbi:MAG: efflux transporter periplasmic adaptor subunit, partial [Nitrospiraceae bacterium]